MANETDWNAEYEREREEQGKWVALMAQVGWSSLVAMGKMRCRSIRDSRGMLRGDAEVAEYNFELGMLAGIEWMLQLPAAESDAADERAAHALAMLREENLDEEVA